MKRLTINLMMVMGMLSQMALAGPPVFVDDYEQAVKRTDKSVLVVFGTDWCSHCKKLKNEKDSLNLDDYVVCMVDADANSKIAKKNSVSSYPTSIIVYEGKEVSRKSGYKKSDYQKWLDSNRKEPKKEAEKPAEKKDNCACGCSGECGCGCGDKCECGFFCFCGWKHFFGLGAGK